MATTIQVSNSIKKKLDQMKVHKRESYNEVIENMLEDEKELNGRTKREIKEARKGIAEDEYLTHKEVKRKLDL